MKLAEEEWTSLLIPAKQAGIRKGDVILLLNNVKVKDADHFKTLVASLPAGKSVPILVQRRGGPIFLAMKLAEEEWTSLLNRQD